MLKKLQSLLKCVTIFFNYLNVNNLNEDKRENKSHMKKG